MWSAVCWTSTEENDRFCNTRVDRQVVVGEDFTCWNRPRCAGVRAMATNLLTRQELRLHIFRRHRRWTDAGNTWWFERVTFAVYANETVTALSTESGCASVAWSEHLAWHHNWDTQPDSTEVSRTVKSGSQSDPDADGATVARRLSDVPDGDLRATSTCEYVWQSIAPERW